MVSAEQLQPQPKLKFLSKVEDVIEIAGRGCVVVPGIPREFPSLVRIGDSIWIECSGKVPQQAIIRGIEFVSPGPATSHPVLVSSSREEFPLGAKLFVDLDSVQDSKTQ